MRQARATIKSFLENDRLVERRLALFLAENEWPLVGEEGVLFAYRGAADSVSLQHWIYGMPSSQPFQRLGDTDFWYLEFELPSESRIEYKLDVVVDGKRRWILDPLNPRTARDPFGSNSVCYGPGYERPDWTRETPGTRSGTLTRRSLKSRAFGDKREFQVYLPARFRRRRRYPLLIVHDGVDYLKYAQLKVVLDNLIQRLEIAPMIVALIQAHERLIEYAADSRHSRFVCHELLPLLASEFPLQDSPASRGLLGASFGAVASLHAAWSHPDTFGRVLIQSGSFAFSEIGPHGRGEIFDPVVDFVSDFRRRPGRPCERLFMSCGVYEPLIYENRSLLPLLQKTEMEIRYVEARDGHNWQNWRDRIRDGLSWTFPGPLWMVYE